MANFALGIIRHLRSFSYQYSIKVSFLLFKFAVGFRLRAEEEAFDVLLYHGRLLGETVAS